MNPEDIPNIITSPFEMVEPNEPIKIYEGEFLLKKGTEFIKLDGSVLFHWFPRLAVYFSGIVDICQKAFWKTHSWKYSLS